MGPNGSGKSTLALTLIGHPKYAVKNGEIKFENKNLISLSVDQRSKLGLFLSFQNPIEIKGVTLRDFLYQIYISKNKDPKKISTGDHKPTGVSIIEFEKLLQEKIKLV